MDPRAQRTVDAIRRGTTAGTIRKVNTEEMTTVLWPSWNGIISGGAILWFAA